MTIGTCSYRSIIKGSGIFDIVILLPFAIPGVVELMINFMAYLHSSLSISGNMPEFSPFNLLFA